MARPNRTYIRDVENILRDANITSFCVYALYGYYDLLVRMWATDQKRRRFQALVKPDYISEISEFIAQDIKYLWTEPANLSSEDLTRAKGSIDEICRTLDLKQSPDPNLLQVLTAQGVIHELLGAGEQFKIFVAFSRTPGQPRVPVLEEQNFEDFFKQGKDRLGMSSISLYTGLGFTEYLVKFVINDFDAAFHCNQEIIQHFEKLHLRPTTYLVANREARESDHVDVGWRELSGSALEMDRALQSKYAPDIAKMAPRNREMVAGLFEKYAALKETNFGKVLEDLFAAKIRNDQTQLARAMTVLLEFEGYLTAYFYDLWKTIRPQSGLDWFQIAKKAAMEMKLSEDDVRKPTLDKAPSLTNKLIELGHIEKSRLEDDFGKEWFDQIRNLSRFRNDLAHGRVFIDPSYLESNWADMTKSLCEIAFVYNKLFEKYRVTNHATNH